MMKSKKIGFALTLLLWLRSLCVVGLARRVIAHEYLHSLSPQAKTELPSSTRRVALPILAADVTQGLSKAPFFSYWIVVWLSPVLLTAWAWRATDDVTALFRWMIGMATYAIFMCVSTVLLAFSLWLPMRR